MATRAPEWLDLMYNPRLTVADALARLADWTRRSEPIRRGKGVSLDVPFGDHADERLDIFPARTGAPAPVLVLVHGGYWRSLDKRDHAYLAPHFAEQGVCVVMPNYTLCPATTVPGIVLQVVRSLAWTWRHIAAYGGDPSRITVVGHSAGGHLAAMMMACLWREVGPDLPSQLVRNALSISGLHDLTPLMTAPFLQGVVNLTPAQVQQASPALLPAPGQGTLYSVVGGDESTEFHRQARLIQRAWGRRRVPLVESLAGLNHFTVLESLAQPGARLNQLAWTLLRA